MKRNYKWLLKRIIKGNIAVLIGMIFVYFAIGILRSCSVLVVQKIIALVNTPNNTMLILLVAAFVAIEIFKSLESSISEISELYLQKRIFNNFYKDLCEKIHNVSILHFDSAKFLISLERARKAIDFKIIDFIKQFFSLVAVFSTILSLCMVIADIDIKFLMYFIIMSIIQNVILFLNSRDTVELFKNQDKNWHKENYYKDLLQNRVYSKEIRDYNCYQWIADKRINNYNTIMDEHILFSKKWSVINIMAGILLFLLEGGMFVLVFYQLYNDILTADVAVLLIQTQMLFCGTIFSCIEYFTNIKEDISYMDSLLEVMGKSDSCVKRKKSINGDIELNHIYFEYHRDKMILEDINLNIQKGDKLALIGENGSGKSTLAKILIGLIEPSEGEILQANWESAAIFQDFSRFFLKVKEEIWVGNLDEDIKQFRQFYTIDKKFDFIQELPKGEETFLGPEIYEDGVELSGGQWQKLALLRAIISKAELIIFDEPTAALDPIAEKECFQEIEDLLKEKTVIIITHRIGLTKYSNKIVFLQNGRIIEQGTYEQLMSNTNGIFRNYYQEQSKWYK